MITVFLRVGNHEMLLCGRVLSQYVFLRTCMLIKLSEDPGVDFLCCF